MQDGGLHRGSQLGGRYDRRDIRLAIEGDYLQQISNKDWGFQLRKRPTENFDRNCASIGVVSG